jgi:hypothetical protein
MERFEAHRIWIEQCMACAGIRARFGQKSAFDYLVLEKLATFAEGATSRPDFAQELPAFVAEVRRLFTPDDLRVEFARFKAEISPTETEQQLIGSPDEEDDPFVDSPAMSAERTARFDGLKELLLARQLGIS